MKKKEIMEKVATKFRKPALKLKKHSPEILIVAGVVGVVTSTVIACKATTKLSSILEESKETVEQIHKCAEDESMADRYSQEDAKKDLTITYVQTGVKVAKLYAPAVALGAVSIFCILKSNDILRKRNVEIAAAYATISKTFKEYRGRVVERFGEDVDNELRYNIKAKKIEEEETDPETGKTKKVKKTVGVADPTVNDYTIFFDAETSEYYEDDINFDLFLLRSQQTIAQNRLVADKSLFLSDVYQLIGIKPTKASRHVGWTYDPDRTDECDNFVDFGITVTHREREDGSIEKVILLNFNVDGCILNRI